LGISCSEQMLHLLCESGQKTLNAVPEDVEQNVQTISAFEELCQPQ
jgi:hypothetical protein